MTRYRPVAALFALAAGVMTGAAVYDQAPKITESVRTNVIGPEIDTIEVATTNGATTPIDIEMTAVAAAVMPLSLKLPEGFKPSYCKNNRPGCMPTYSPTAGDCCKIVCPSPMVTICSSSAKGNNSRNRHTPLKSNG